QWRLILTLLDHRTSSPPDSYTPASVNSSYSRVLQFLQHQSALVRFYSPTERSVPHFSSSSTTSIESTATLREAADYEFYILLNGEPLAGKSSLITICHLMDGRFDEEQRLRLNPPSRYQKISRIVELVSDKRNNRKVRIVLTLRENIDPSRFRT